MKSRNRRFIGHPSWSLSVGELDEMGDEAASVRRSDCVDDRRPPEAEAYASAGRDPEPAHRAVVRHRFAHPRKTRLGAAEVGPSEWEPRRRRRTRSVPSGCARTALLPREFVKIAAEALLFRRPPVAVI